MKDEITADEHVILLTINFRPDISQSELAKVLFKGKAHIGKILNDMESRGLIRRIADTRDNIIVKRNELTEKGINIIEESLPKTECIRNAMDKEFSQEDIIQFTSYLKRYRKVLASIVDVKLK